jgi:uncharacterized protein (TIGR02001 family)
MAQWQDANPPSGASKATTPATPATPAAPSFDASMVASIATDYNYRGYTLSNHLPSAAADFEGTYGIWFVDFDSASVDMPRLSHYQMTDYTGVRPVIGDLTVEAGVEYYAYPGSTLDISYFEYYLLPTYAVTSKLTLGLSANYANDYSRTGAWETFNSVTAKYTFDSGLALSGELGHQDFGITRPTVDSPAIRLPSYTYWSLGVSYTYKSLTLDLHYYATSLSPQRCYLITGTGQPGTGSNGCDPTVIATLSWNGKLSDLK